MLLPGATAFDRLNTGSVQGAEPQAPGDLGVTRRDAGECNERSKASHKGYVKIVLKSCKLRTLNVSIHLVAAWPYRRERAITRNKRYLFSLQSVTDSSYQALNSNEDLSPLVDHQPASACQKLKTAILQGFRSSMVGAASQDGDVQNCSYPSIAPRRTFPPVGPYSPLDAHGRDGAVSER